MVSPRRDCAPDVALATAADPAAVERARRRRLVVAGGLTLAGTAAVLAYPTSTGRALPPGEGAPGLHGPAITAIVGGPVTGVYRGRAAVTDFGPVVVEVELVEGAAVRATVVSYPRDDGRDRMINDRAVPLLEEQTVERQTAGVDAVTGATSTSEGYVESLQAALDLARRDLAVENDRASRDDGAAGGPSAVEPTVPTVAPTVAPTGVPADSPTGEPWRAGRDDGATDPAPSGGSSPTTGTDDRSQTGRVPSEYVGRH